MLNKILLTNTNAHVTILCKMRNVTYRRRYREIQSIKSNFMRTTRRFQAMVNMIK
uniref:Uncharacterized protein n=1 Tax=Meloidogyne enterolobii TaxID=390850 RepID=A0A6V7VC28_MELEN|nr:unnamed protein product [Meloidogyne enterolobii]